MANEICKISCKIAKLFQTLQIGFRNRDQPMELQGLKHAVDTATAGLRDIRTDGLITT
jgi:hypothetical protein